MELEIPGSGDVQKRSLRSEDFICDDAWRTSKMSRTESDFSIAANAAVSSAFPDYWQHRNSGYYTSVSSDASTGVYLLNGVKGPFTLSQWLELEHQALIYRYITANQPIPIQLLIPIRKAFDSAGFYGLQGGWGSFHMGYSNSTDPEPGRCRRTDGKKWRCSKEAVENQKYCDKHINRGRHRSRKHVECQATKPSTTKPVLPDCGSSNGKNLQTIGLNQNMNTSLNRTIVNNRDTIPQPSYGSYTNILDDPKESEPQDSLFTLDNWPKDNHINVDFMSSTCTPTNEKVSFTSQWEASMGGPLAEALQSKSISNKADESMKNSVMTLLPNGWEGNGRSQLSSSSPNVVLQMSSLVSLSNKSAGSSPMEDMYGSVT